MTSNGKPPFRADHVGSLLRPEALANAREDWRQGKLSAADLKSIEDDHIRDVVALQEAAGLQSITDGEFRRDYWHLDFLCAFDGIEQMEELSAVTFSTGKAAPRAIVVDKVGKNSGAMHEHFAFLKSVTTRTPKMCIPAPAMMYMGMGRKTISEEAYPDLDEFWHDLIAAYQTEVQAFADLGCRYLQFDDTSLAFMCDLEFRDKIKERGDDPDAMIETFCKATTAAASKRPADMVVTTHMCRGNFQSDWAMQGGYEATAEIMFANLDVDAYFMEYDDERSGGFEPLKFVPDGKTVVLGLITSKRADLEPKDEIKRRIDEATKYVPLDRLCLSPQCGFASTHHGNKLTEDEERKKLEWVVEIADEVWGNA